jgi:hypothetical protein
VGQGALKQCDSAYKTQEIPRGNTLAQLVEKVVLVDVIFFLIR